MMCFFRVIIQILGTCLVYLSGLSLNATDPVQAFISLDAVSPLKRHGKHNYRSNVEFLNSGARWVKPSHRSQDKNNDNQLDTTTAIEGLLSEDEFSRFVAVDETIRALKMQLPTILTKSLSPAMAEKVYSKDNFCFSVSVDDESATGIIDTVDDDGVKKRDSIAIKKNEIVILNNREELMALSDVLVLTTAAAQQAILVTGASDTRVKIECELIIDDSCRILRIPWRAKAPTLGTLSPLGSVSSFNNFEGVTDCYLNTSNNFGKVERFIVRKASFNGRILNGPAIGQALKSVQSTLANLQQNPILQNIVRTAQQGDNNNNRASSIFNTLRDEFFDQASTALSNTQTTSSEESLSATSIQVHQVHSVSELSLIANNGWITDQAATFKNTESLQSSKHRKYLTPCPGTEDWEKYENSRSCLLRFSNDIIPKLIDLSIVDPSLFAEDVTFEIAADESILMTGRESLANFYQSMALTRKGTRGTLKVNRCEVLNWRNRTIAISYEVTTSSLPLWTIEGRDIYILDTNTSEDDRPIIKAIRQGKMFAIGPNGNTLKLDGRWLTDNVATVFQRDGTSSSRDFLTELLMNQPSLSPFLQQQKVSTGSRNSSGNRKLSKSVAAASYYIMSDLYEQGSSLFDMPSSNRRSPPGSDYISENIELKGYLGESIVRGSSLYNRSIGSFIFGIRESIRQKRLLIEDVSVPPRVELLVPTGVIRLSLTFLFRIPPLGVGIMPSQDSRSLASGLPLKIEITSDYRIDPDTGVIVEHRLVETRINGQLTAGDQVSRWMQRFLKVDGSTATTTRRKEDGALSAILDAISWFRST